MEQNLNDKQIKEQCSCNDRNEVRRRDEGEPAPSSQYNSDGEEIDGSSLEYRSSARRNISEWRAALKGNNAMMREELAAIFSNLDKLMSDRNLHTDSVAGTQVHDIVDEKIEHLLQRRPKGIDKQSETVKDTEDNKDTMSTSGLGINKHNVKSPIILHPQASTATTTRGNIAFSSESIEQELEPKGKATWLSDKMTSTCKVAMPVTSYTKRISAPWWSEHLAQLRTTSMACRRQYTRARRRRRSTTEEIDAAYKKYQEAAKVFKTAVADAKSRLHDEINGSSDSDEN